jgi:chaperonin cofactor prefoldin
MSKEELNERIETLDFEIKHLKNRPMTCSTPKKIEVLRPGELIVKQNKRE